MSNKTATYWLENYPYFCASIEAITGDELTSNAYHLASIAEDYSAMTDDEVIATIINENTEG